MDTKSGTEKTSDMFTIDEGENNLEDASPDAGAGGDMQQYSTTMDNDIQVETVEDLDVEMAEHSLPTSEELKASLPPTSRKGRNICLVVTLLLAIIGIVLVPVAVSKKNKNKSAEHHYPERTEEVIQFLWDNKVTDLPDLRTPGSPALLAAEFLADGDAYNMALTEANKQKFIERYVMVLMYYSMGGTEWTYKLNFLSAVDHCEWNGLFTTGSGNTIREGVLCDGSGKVIKLNLGKKKESSHKRVLKPRMMSFLMLYFSNAVLFFKLAAYNNLVGAIPLEIKQLKDLDTFHLHFNGGIKQSGLPEGFLHMPNLKSVALQYCEFSGTIQSWIGQLGQLTTLAVGNNRFYGTLPDSFANLSNLSFLALDDNNELKGNIELFKGMKKLKTLYMEDNFFDGELFDIVEHWPNLVELDMSRNMITGTLPASVFNHPSMGVADLHGNYIFGEFPEDIFENTALQGLSLHQNSLKGSIPDRIAYLSNMKHLDLSFNRLTGTIPDTFGMMTELRYLATSGNSFDAQSLIDLQHLTHLRDLSMKANNITGRIPNWIGANDQLQLLDLDGNKLTGSIPSWIGMLSGLDHLLLNRNLLTGTLPSEMKRLNMLSVLLIDSNSIRGNADAVCVDGAKNPAYFIADCYPAESGKGPEIECRCCTQCCLDGDVNCNNKAWTSNVDPMWEYGFVRPNYKFSLDNAPGSYAKGGDEGSTQVDPLP
jgi:Leucine-rich repeat (LRR) protein